MRTFDLFKWGVRPFIGHGLGAVKPLSAMYQVLARRMIPERERVVEINGYKLKVSINGRGVGGIVQGLIFDHKYEPFSTEIFKSLVSNGDTVIDVGANIGYYTLLASRLVGNTGRVIAFEPEPLNYSDLMNNVTLNHIDNVQAKRMAVSNKRSIATLHLSKDEPGAHSLEPCRNTSESIEVPTVTLDEVAKFPVHFIKVDTEGHEMCVLEGANETLKQCKALMIECWEDGLIAAGYSIRKMLTLIESYGFSVDMMDEYDKRLVSATECAIHNYSKKHKFSVNLICRR